MAVAANDDSAEHLAQEGLAMAADEMPWVDFTQVGPPVGERFPDVQLPDQTGQVVDLHVARAGRPALVVFHRSAGW